MAAPKVQAERRRLTVGLGPSHVAGEPGTVSKEDDQLVAQAANSIAYDGRRTIAARFTHTDSKKKEFSDKDYIVSSYKEGSLQCQSSSSDDDGGPDLATVVNFQKCCIKALAYTCHKGKKPDAPNQDSYSVLISEGEFGLYCVYDGHGPQGHLVSELVRERLVNKFVDRKLSPEPLSTEECFKRAFKAMQEELVEINKTKEEADVSMSGTTCTMVYHEVKDRKLHIAHVGDSRAIVYRRPKDGKWENVAATIDHKPDVAKEKAFIESHGGRVVFDGYYNYRVFAQNGSYPGLNMSRALGDVAGYTDAGLSAEPDVQEINLNSYPGTWVILLCTDGVWEFTENDEALNTLTKEIEAGETRNEPGSAQESLQGGLRKLASDSYQKWMKDSDNEISDDITGIAVVLE